MVFVRRSSSLSLSLLPCAILGLEERSFVLFEWAKGRLLLKQYNPRVQAKVHKARGIGEIGSML